MFLDFLFVLTPFLVAWWLTGWPGKRDPEAVKMAGLGFIFFGLSMLLRLALLGRQMPAGRQSTRLLTTAESVQACAFFMGVGVVVLLVYAFFQRRR